MVFGLILRFAETRRVAVTWRRRELKRSSKIAPTIFNDFLDTKKDRSNRCFKLFVQRFTLYFQRIISTQIVRRWQLALVNR